MKMYGFISNVEDFKHAVNAKYFSGPLETNYSTDSIEIDPSMHGREIVDMIEKKFPEHKVFSGTSHLYLYDENGNEVK